MSIEIARAPSSVRTEARFFTLVIALGLVGCASGTPPSADSVAAEHWQAQLLDRSALRPEERTQQARAVLRTERLERIEDLHQRTLEAAWRVALRASPQRIWSGARRVFRAIRRFRKPGAQEDVALRWLAPATETGALPVDSDPYAYLRVRELHRLADARRTRARAALEGDRFDVARRLIARADVLEPGSEATVDLRRDLDREELEWKRLEPQLTVRAWDAALASSILANDLSGALASDRATDPEVTFVHAAAELLRGERDSARVGLLELAARPDALGTVASGWLERPEVDVEGDLTRSIHEYRMKRWLGFIGGNALAERGASLSNRSFSVWKDAFTLTNMGVSIPARLIKGWRPDGTPVRDAAVRYLDRRPHGPQAARARAWLDHVGWPEPDALGLQGQFQLPAAKAAFDRISVPPVIVSRQAIRSGAVTGSPALLSALEGSRAVRLEIRRITFPMSREEELASEGFALTAHTAQRLLDELASGVERDQLRWTLSSREEALEHLRRLSSALRGGVLYAEAWTPPDLNLWNAFASTAIDGAEHRGGVTFERGEDDVIAVSDLGNELRACPPHVLCLDKEHRFRNALYGYLDMSSGAGFGFQSSTRLFGLGLGVTESGPELSFVLPIGRWLGVDSWVPIEAELSLGADPYVGPVLRKKKCTEAQEDPEEASVRRLLPLGLRSRCVLRLY